MIIAREAYLITGGNTIQPSGLNKKKAEYNCYFFILSHMHVLYICYYYFIIFFIAIFVSNA